MYYWKFKEKGLIQLLSKVGIKLQTRWFRIKIKTSFKNTSPCSMRNQFLFFNRNVNYWICDSQVKFTVEWEYLLYILTLTFTKCIPENSHLGNPPEMTPTTLLHCQFVQHIHQWSKSLMPLMSTLKEILLEIKQSNYFQEANKAAKVSGILEILL